VSGNGETRSGVSTEETGLGRKRNKGNVKEGIGNPRKKQKKSKRESQKKREIKLLATGHKKKAENET